MLVGEFGYWEKVVFRLRRSFSPCLVLSFGIAAVSSEIMLSFISRGRRSFLCQFRKCHKAAFDFCETCFRVFLQPFPRCRYGGLRFPYWKNTAPKDCDPLEFHKHRIANVYTGNTCIFYLYNKVLFRALFSTATFIGVVIVTLVWLIWRAWHGGWPLRVLKHCALHPLCKQI